MVYHGIDIDIFDTNMKKEDLRKIYHIPQDKTILLYVGRFSKDKNFLELLETFSILDNLYKDTFHLILVGDGPDKKYIEKMCKNYTLLEYIKNKRELSLIYHLSDIFISASKTDTFGYSLIEAQSCGLPVVAYKVASFPEVVFYKEFLADDQEEFINNIISLSKSSKHINKHSLKSFVEKHFNLNQNMSKLEKIYEKLCPLLV